MKLLVLNGPNINMLGIREPDLYGNETYRDLVRKITNECRRRGIKVAVRQSNCEGKLVTEIQKARGRYDGIILNAAAYTHTSIAILDALKCSRLPCAEVHITDIKEREEYRARSFVSEYAFVVIKGEGTNGYVHAVDALVNYLKKQD
ncbi:MAG: 3-dehydroquinate dehydratase [Firmicutes bacterium]|nr:3-dehydroquinate dehydratase [Bacillota bacterium]MDY5530774.1 type II 3-dehydroquinate dehydratase [Pumilibacteraceae bacterium]